MDTQDLENRFTYRPPKPGQPEIYQILRAKALMVAGTINTHVPDGREKSIAITKLEEVMMWANAGIARGKAETSIYAPDSYTNGEEKTPVYNVVVNNMKMPCAGVNPKVADLMVGCHGSRIWVRSATVDTPDRELNRGDTFDFSINLEREFIVA
ncbi:hypothetical protein LCGC14_1770450 [marine sediment metagenome]|uniref:Acb2/Tad1 hairpin domain-containing protein n=1 Tax=marine sediment metagenome TaxID=412755 RepID=A0A0F9GYG1_9ZZZZ